MRLFSLSNSRERESEASVQVKVVPLVICSLSLVMRWRICQFDTNRGTLISIYRKQQQQQDVRLRDSVNTAADPELEWHTVDSTGPVEGGMDGLIRLNFCLHKW